MNCFNGSELKVTPKLEPTQRLGTWNLQEYVHHLALVVLGCQFSGKFCQV